MLQALPVKTAFRAPRLRQIELAPRLVRSAGVSEDHDADVTDVSFKELVVNDCFAEPCTNGATCQNLAVGYTCLCLPGYTGTILLRSDLLTHWICHVLCPCASECGVCVGGGGRRLPADLHRDTVRDASNAKQALHCERFGVRVSIFPHASAT